jgi:calmodulin
MRYFGLRRAFINPLDSTQHVLPQDFDFSKYLSLLLGELLGEIVEITPVIWIGLEVFLFLICAASLLSAEVFFGIWVAIAWVFFFSAYLMSRNLEHIRKMVTPNVKDVSFSNGAAINADLEMSETSSLLPDFNQFQVLDKQSNEMITIYSARPAYLNQPLRVRSSFGKNFLGKPPNRHEACFPFDRHGVHFYVQIFRLLLLLMSVYLALLAVRFGVDMVNTYGGGIGALLIILSVIPFLVVVFKFIPQSIITLVVVSNVEKMRKQETISKVLRDMHTRKALKLLSLLQIIQFYSRKVKIGSNKKVNSQEINIQELPHEKLQELKEVFALFDTDGSGNVDAHELKDILSLLGEEITELEAEGMIQALDQDGNGTLDFDEFCKFMSMHQHESYSQDLEEMARSLFEVFDRDGSGQVSAAEFRSLMLQLCHGQLEEEDVDMVIDEIDKDKNGEIDLKEFGEMLKYYLKA